MAVYGVLFVWEHVLALEVKEVRYKHSNTLIKA